jgi:large subunit ribosomal protein L13
MTQFGFHLPSSFGGFGAATRFAPFFCVKSAPFRKFAMKTYTAKAGEVEQGWFVVDAQGKVLGRLAVQIAARLRGKHKPQYTPHVDTGDYIVVVNAAKLRVTGRKAERKIYYRHSGVPGHLKETSFGKLHAAHPERVLQKAVKGMLPKGPLGYAMLRKLKVYAGGTHPHSAQQPRNLEI